MMSSSSPVVLEGRTRYFSTGEVAEILVEGTDYVLREVRAGRLPCERRIPRKLGRTIYKFTAEEVCAYLHEYDSTRLAAFHVALQRKQAE